MKQYPVAPSLSIEVAKRHQAELATNRGPISIRLAPRPLSAGGQQLRVPGAGELLRRGDLSSGRARLVIQGGDPTGTGRGGPGYRFRDELEGEGRYRRGTVAMAKAGPNINGSQFFICRADLGLAHSYTVFGEVTAGMETVDSIAASKCKGERPLEDAVIESVSIA